MTIEDFFGDWGRVLDLHETERTVHFLLSKKVPLCPQLKDVFKAFQLCSLSNLKLVILGQDPYSTLRPETKTPVATGLAFANAPDTPDNEISPSLKKIKESVIDFTRPHGIINFDPSLEKWESQGVLLLNSALTCQTGVTGSHTMLWRPFMKSLLTNLSRHSPGTVFVLLGNNAQSFEYCINKRFNYIFCDKHPSYYARTQTRMPSDLWEQVNNIIKGQCGQKIKWYDEY